ncbi:MAG: hypothetical protein DRR06_05110 [Gammaproteobacteria bacterium]|nr:MAG: hypothetical protein DRR06_05110 [Gammaproteobacteria bacterium]
MSTENTNLTIDNDSSNPAPNIESAIAGDYDFTISEVLTESWKKTNGMKGPFWGAGVIVFIVAILTGIVLNGIAGVLDFNVSANSSNGNPNVLYNLLSQLIGTAVIYPFMAGIIMLGVRRSVDLPISVNEAFAYFAYVLPLVVAAILMSILMTLGFILLVIPGIYLSVAYLFTVPLIVEKNMEAWQAMETSRKTVTRHWFKFFGLMIVMGVIVLVSALPFGIGLIWTYPMLVIALGILYRDIFGVEQTE